MPKNRDLELDPHFFVPPGVIDVRQDNKDNRGSAYVANQGLIATGGPVLETPTSAVPNAPAGYTIVSQTLRQTSDGRTVVDVVLEFPDIGPYEIDIKTRPA